MINLFRVCNWAEGKELESKCYAARGGERGKVNTGKRRYQSIAIYAESNAFGTSSMSLSLLEIVRCATKLLGGCDWAEGERVESEC